MTLVEGRNRQIRKMMEALGHAVIKLHRTEFMGIRLVSPSGAGGGRGGGGGGDGGGGSSLERPGDWAYLNDEEMRLVEDALWSAYEEI
jgi:16S rRNA U516 pseudouridylate synthase RsuA-like enzyme